VADGNDHPDQSSDGDESVSESKLSGFHKLSIPERVRAICDRGLLSEEDARALLSGDRLLTLSNADTMIENVVGVMGLPLGLALNFLVNGKDYVVPLSVEEPSVVAALNFAAKTVRAAGGFRTGSTEPILVGQIQVVDVPHASRARQNLLQRKEEVLNLANSLHPRLVARGGGATDLEVVLYPSRGDLPEMLVVHLLVDTCDAMGANLVNSMCEAAAPRIAEAPSGSTLSSSSARRRRSSMSCRP